MLRNLRDRVKAGGKEGKEQMFWREMLSKEKQDVFPVYFSLLCFRFPCMQMLFPHSSFLCANFLSLSHKYIFEKRGRRKEREKIIMSPFPFSPPSRPFKFSHREKFSSFLSHFFGKREKKKRERHLNGGQEKGDILLLLLLLLSKLRTSHGDPQNEFYKVGGGSEKTTPLGQVFTHKV